MNRTKGSSILSMVLIAVLIFTAIFNIVYTGAVDFGGKSDIAANVASANKGGISKSDINMDSVREQYLNFETVEKNTAAFDGERWVVVELEGSSLYDEFKKSARFADFAEYSKSIEAKKALANIKAKQSRFLDKLDRYGVDYTYKYSYSALSTGVAIKVDASGYNTIAAMSGVSDVFYSESYAVPEFSVIHNNANVYSTGIYDTNELVNIDLNGDGQPDGTFQGQGMAVAILDTGLDSTHAAFDPQNFLEELKNAGAENELRYSKSYISELLNDNKLNAEQFGAGLNDLYYNEKVPFAYDYADDDAEVFPGYSNHGTHVAGIVAGKDDSYVVGNGEDGEKGTSDDETFRGVAPLAQLVICKVFTDNLYSDTLGGANDIDILAALDDCATLGVDVINMSLGTSAGFSDERSKEHSTEVYNRIRSLGISLVCAASNDYSSGFGGGNGTNLSTNPDSGTVGSPSTYFSALSVASINGQQSKYIQGNDDEDQVAFITNASDGDGNRLEFIDELRRQLAEKYGPDSTNDLRGGDVFTKGTSGDIVLKYVLVGGVGRPNNYTSTIKNQLRSRTYNGTKVDGTVALVKRGDTTFAEKVQEAMSAGADAVIIYNNVSGTINMSLGEVNDPVPTCLITMDASVPFVDFAKSHSSMGTVKVSDSFEAGPFMSDFSSWGPVSDLTLKPEITAHGGEITSAVPGAYDVLSGTSMASPNMAGAVAVLRQYLQETTGLDGNELNARVNQVLMSTATIARNEEGNPYSPRKQGAGLAGITDAVLSEGYITVKPYGKAAEVYTDQNVSTQNCIVDGWLDKTKIELFDDPERKGEYELEFTVWNTTSVQQIYSPTTYVMTETLASDMRTVAEKAYMLTDMCDITYSGDGYANGRITVPANSHVNVKVTVKLGDKAREYFAQKVTRQIVGTDGRPISMTVEPFKNGMYVEGFVSLDNVTNGEDASAKGVTLGVPYLAFYGDWTDAPLFDYDVYEVSESEGNSAIDFENKLKSTSLPSQVIGMYHNDDYIIPLGSYLYEMDEEDDDIYPEREKIALSQYDEEGSYTVYELYAAYAGLLRNAAEVKTVVTNARTGEVVYEETLNNVGKAYAAGGGNRGAFVRYEINPSEWGWQNNDEFYFKVEGWLDYKNKDGKLAQSTAKDDEPQTAWKGTRNTFEFPLTIDYEAPQIIDYNIRFDSYKEFGVTKYRTYLDLDVYDNQYVMAVLPCFLKEEHEGRLGTYLNLLTEYPIPVYGGKGETSRVSIDITDYYEKYLVNGDPEADNGLYIQVEDYAMNSEVYNITLDEDSLTYPVEAVTFLSDSKLTKKGDATATNDNNRVYPVYNLTIDPFELYKFNIPTTREKEFILQNLHWEGASDFVKVNGDEVFALAKGPSTTLRLVGEKSVYVNDNIGWNTFQAVYAQVNVTVSDGKARNMPTPSSINFKPIHAGDNHVVNLDGNAAVEVHPNINASKEDEPYRIEAYISPWYFEAAYKFKNGKDFEFEWSSSQPSVATIEQYGDGTVQFLTHGSASVTCTAKDKDNYRFLSKSVTFIVSEDYYVNNYYLLDWYGGEKVEIPTDVNVMYLDEDCFKNDKTIKEVILPPLLMEIPDYAFQNCENLEKITIPSQCAYIGPHAFEGCKNLKTVVFPEYVDSNKDPVPGYFGSITVGHYAFAGCEKLKEFITDKLDENGDPIKSHRMTVMYDGAFAGCTGLEEIDISALRVVGTGVFAGCTSLRSVTTSEATAIGPYMFGGYSAGPQRALYCSSLKTFDFKGNYLPEGAFSGCSALDTFTFSGKELRGIGAYALANTALKNIQLPAGDYTIGEGAFANCENLDTVTVNAGSTLTFDGLNPFDGCEKLTSFAITGEGDMTVIDGALYKGDTLISLPAGKTEYTLPEGITKIGDSALSGSALDTIDLTGITSIGKYAFAGSSLKSVMWPDSLTEIAEGAFMDCAQLSSFTGLKVKKIGAYAFAGCTQLSTLNFPEVTEIGDYAFYFLRNNSAVSNALATVAAPNLNKIGAYAFAGAGISNADYAAATEIGEGAFRKCEKLTSASFGAVTKMGDFAFYGTAKLRSASFADGTTTIGNYAFSTFDPRVDVITPYNAVTTDEKVLLYVRQNYMNITTSTTLATVTLPSTVTSIGAFAFTGQSGLRTLETSGVQSVGDNAFRLCGALSGLDLRKVQTVGNYAFYGTSLKSVELDEATVIGDYAFAGGAETLFSVDGLVGFNFARTRAISGGQITSLTMKKVQRIGAFAFAGNKLKTVEIPSSMDSRTYTFEEKLYDDKGREERSRTRIANTFGAGAFAYNQDLSEITVAGDNPAFTSIGGVLYSYIDDDKLELVQYPSANTKNVVKGTYQIAKNTVSIGASSFEGTDGGYVNAVDIPYTVKVIGSSAFYGTGIFEYTFHSVQAPTLVAANDPYATEVSYGLFSILYYMQIGHYPWDVEDPQTGEMYLELDNIFISAFYGNFVDYVFLSGFGNIFYQFVFPTLTFNVPQNGVGYDSELYVAYAQNLVKSENKELDDNSYEVINKLEALMSEFTLESIKTMSADELKEGGKIDVAVRAAREAYNKVSDSEQLELIKAQYEQLLQYEKALRDARIENHIVVTVESVRVASQPTQIRYYAGETFKADGMVIAVMYSDGSEIRISAEEFERYGVTIEDPIVKPGKPIVVIYKDALAESPARLEIVVNVSNPSTPSGPSGPSGGDPSSPAGDNGAGLPAWAIAIIAVGAALIVAAAVVLIILKKKRGAQVGKKKAEKSSAKPEKAEEKKSEDKNDMHAEEKPEAPKESENAPSEDAKDENAGIPATSDTDENK